MHRQIGPYRLLGELGRGGMGVTYRAQSPELGREVALKLAQPGLAGPEECARLLREARLLRAIDHPFVVGFLDAGEHLGVPYLVMELVDGEDLRARLRREGPLAPLAAARLARQVAEGVGELHRLGIVHRDLKPENVLLDRRESPRVCDLGIARSEELSRLTLSGDLIGTPAYLAPEQARGEAAGPEADVYALGCLLFELVSGALPFAGSALQVVTARERRPAPALGTARPGVPPELEQVVARCLERDPAERYPDAEALARALGAIAHAPLARRRRVPRGLWLASGLSLVAATAGVGALLSAQPAPATDASALARALEAAGDLLRRERWHEAYQRFEEAARVDPRSVDAWTGLGRVAARQGHRELALTHFARALELDPEARDALLSTSSLRAMAGDVAGGYAALERARAAHPGDPQLVISAAHLELLEGDASPARTRLEAFLAGTPGDSEVEAEARALLGRILCGRGDWEPGLALLREAYALDPVPYYAGLVVTLRDQRQDSPSEICAELEGFRAGHAESQTLERLYAVYGLWRRDGNPEGALEVLDRICAREPESYEPRVDRAGVLVRLDRRLVEAQEDLEQALRAERSWEEAWLRRTQVAQALDDGPGALRASRAWARCARSTAKDAYREWVEWAHRCGTEAEFAEAAEAVWARDPSTACAFQLALRSLLRRAPGTEDWLARGLALDRDAEGVRDLSAVWEFLCAPTPAGERAVRRLVDATAHPGLAQAARFALAAGADLVQREEFERWDRGLRGNKERDPWLVLATSKLAQTLGRYAQAEDGYAWVLLQRPRCAEALAGIARLYADLGGDAEAAGLAALAVELAREDGLPPPPEAETLVGGQGGAAIREAWAPSGGELAERALAAQEARDLPLQHVLGWALVARAPEDPRGWVVLGLLYARRERLRASERTLTRALLLGPRDPETCLLLASAALRYDDAALARDCARRARGLEPEGFAARQLELVLSVYAGDEERALRLAAEVWQDFAGQPRAYMAWAVIAGLPAGEAGLRAAMQPDAPGHAWLACARTSLRQGALERAQEELQRARAAGGANPKDLLLIQADVARGLGDRATAEEALNALLEVDPLAPGGWSGLGELAVEAGDWQEARRCASRALAVCTEGEAPRALRVLLAAERADGRDAAAQIVARELIEANPQDVVGLVALVELAESRAEAQEHARALLGCPDLSEAQRTLAQRTLAGAE
ncbi:MAG: protein kinase [Planctomycetota bacterium]